VEFWQIKHILERVAAVAWHHSVDFAITFVILDTLNIFLIDF